MQDNYAECAHAWTFSVEYNIIYELIACMEVFACLIEEDNHV